MSDYDSTYDPADVTMPFGKYKGLTIGDVAETDGGLRYLDWMVGVANPGRFKDALESFLAKPAVSLEVDAVISDDDDDEETTAFLDSLPY